MPVVELVVDEADAELASDALWQAGARAVSEVPAGPGQVRLLGEVADPARIAGRWAPRVIEPDTAAHLDAWRAWAEPQRAGTHLLLQPAWLPTAAALPDDVVVRLDPGRTFGSGSHPSTRLALAVLEEALQPGDRLLDVGCGSGVLAVAACLLGAATATAVDVEPDAPTVTMRNASANGVGDRVHASCAPLTDVAGRFDVVVANIGLAVLRELAVDLRRRVAPGGLLVLAGLLDHQVDDVVASHPGGTEVERRSLEGWAVVSLRA